MRLLYLHGVGDDGTRRDWWPALTEAAPDGLADVDVYAPDYSDLLSGKTKADAPHRIGDLRPDPHLLARRHYRTRQAALHRELIAAGSQSQWPYRRRGFDRIPGAIDAIGERFVLGVIYDEVSRYCRDDRLRRTIRERVLELMPDDGEVVIVAHSLGALVALDLLPHLPGTVEVPLLITAATSLARRKLPPTALDIPLSFPYHRVRGWINVFNPADAVTRGRPIGMRFPQAIDVAANGSLGDHSLNTCLRQPGIAAAVVAGLTEVTAGSLPAAVGAVEPRESLPQPVALHLARLLLLENLVAAAAEAPDTSPREVNDLSIARDLVLEQLPPPADLTPEWAADPATTLTDHMAESDVAAVLIELTGEDPLASVEQTSPTAALDQARRQTADDLGIPPDWVALAHTTHAQVARSPMRKWRGGRLKDLDLLSPRFQRGARNVTARGREPELVTACRDLLARALLAARLGQPEAGHAEHHTFARVLESLSIARIGAFHSGEQALAERIVSQIETVGSYLSHLASHGLGSSKPRPLSAG